MSKSMEKKNYIAPQTKQALVELEQGFMSASVVNADKLEEPTISIEDQGIGAESNYFDNENQDFNKWSY